MNQPSVAGTSSSSSSSSALISPHPASLASLQKPASGPTGLSLAQSLGTENAPRSVAAFVTGPKCLAAACPGSKDIPFLVEAGAGLDKLDSVASVSVVLCSLTHGEEAVVADDVACREKGTVGSAKLYAVTAPNREVLSRATRNLMSKCGQARASSAMTRFIEIRFEGVCMFRMVFFTKFRDRTANSSFSSNWSQHVTRMWKSCGFGDGATAYDNLMQLVQKTGNVVRLHLHHTAFEKWVFFEPSALDYVHPTYESLTGGTQASRLHIPLAIDGSPHAKALSSPASSTSTLPCVEFLPLPQVLANNKMNGVKSSTTTATGAAAAPSVNISNDKSASKTKNTNAANKRARQNSNAKPDHNSSATNKKSNRKGRNNKASGTNTNTSGNSPTKKVNSKNNRSKNNRNNSKEAATKIESTTISQYPQDTCPTFGEDLNSSVTDLNNSTSTTFSQPKLLTGEPPSRMQGALEGLLRLRNTKDDLDKNDSNQSYSDEKPRSKRQRKNSSTAAAAAALADAVYSSQPGGSDDDNDDEDHVENEDENQNDQADDDDAENESDGTDHGDRNEDEDVAVAGAQYLDSKLWSNSILQSKHENNKGRRVLLQVVQDESGHIELAHLDCNDPQQVLQQALQAFLARNAPEAKIHLPMNTPAQPSSTPPMMPISMNMSISALDSGHGLHSRQHTHHAHHPSHHHQHHHHQHHHHNHHHPHHPAHFLSTAAWPRNVLASTQFMPAADYPQTLG